MSNLALHEVANLAAKSGEAVKSGPWGLAIILLLCVACYFLFKSMSRHLRRVREQFPGRQPPGPDVAAAPPSPGQPPAAPPVGDPSARPTDPPA